MIKKHLTKIVTIASVLAIMTVGITGCSMPGSNDKSGKDTKIEQSEDAYDSSEEVIKAFWKAMATEDEDLMITCFYSKSDAEDDIKDNMDRAHIIADYTEIHTKDIEFEKSDDDQDDIDEIVKDYGYKKFDDAEKYTVTVPMTQDINDVTYDVNDIYEVVTVCYDDAWYIVEIKETNTEIVSQSGGDEVKYPDEDEPSNNEPDNEPNNNFTVIDSVGNSNLGIITLDEGTWVEFIEDDDFSNATGLVDKMQASTTSQSTIITMWTLDTDITTEQLAQNSVAGFEAQGAEEVTGASNQKIGDCSGYQLYCYYPDVDKFLVAWFFETDNDDYKHYVCIEFPENEYDYFEMVQNNYKSSSSTDSGNTNPGYSSNNSVEGFSSTYADLDARYFAIDGHIFEVGVSTMQDMVDAGIVFVDDSNLYNNIKPNYESEQFKVELGEWNNIMIYASNFTDSNKTIAECPITEVYFPIDLEDEGNDRVQFAFPLDLTEEQLVANSGEPTELNDYSSDGYTSKYYNYKVDSTKYYGQSGYEFQYMNGQLKYVYITFK